MTNAVLSIAHALSADYQALIWDSFFAQKQRGVDFHTHFPWAHTAPGDCAFGLLRHEGKLLAGATMRLHRSPRGNQWAALGLICVAPAYRGQGLSTALLEGSLAWLASSGTTRTVLWTNKPAVYTKVGFVLDDSSLFGWVAKEGPCYPPTVPAHVRSWPDEEERNGANRGLPAFCHGAQRWIAAERAASAIVLLDGLGPIVAEWSGPDEAVATLLADALAPRWRLNALRTDSLPLALARRGLQVELNPLSLQMARSLEKPGEAAFQELSQLRVLDRV
ncbi:GNAT family N-acetyltransferase [Ralstonia sp.]|uniref:GNAT family N-acetyltransferase n=1 Tax=Ralstonia sp. TaxID=54061 RepID=UPI00258087E4|nr:GNAT family N-acetyltransferase [Ralstonia sp.]